MQNFAARERGARISVIVFKLLQRKRSNPTFKAVNVKYVEERESFAGPSRSLVEIEKYQTELPVHKLGLGDNERQR